MKQLYQSPTVKLVGIAPNDVLCTSGEQLLEDLYDASIFGFDFS